MGNQQSAEQGGHKTRAAEGSYVATAAAVAELRSLNAAQRWRGLLNLKHAARHNRADSEWAASWVAAGAVRAIIAGSADVPPREAAQQARYGSQALAVLLNDVHAGPAAAAELLQEAVDALQESGPEAASPALYHLLIAALDLPITCKVAAEQGFREVLLQQLVRLLAPQHGHESAQPPLLQAGPSDNLCSSAEGDAATAAAALLAGSPQAARKQPASTDASATVGGPAMAADSGVQRQLAGVPKLALPPGATAMQLGGLTRSSRRAGGNWASREPSPLPSPAPLFPGQNGPQQGSAKAELRALGLAIGEALVITDMTAVVSHHRRLQLAAADQTTGRRRINERSAGLASHSIGMPGSDEDASSDSDGVGSPKAMLDGGASSAGPLSARRPLSARSRSATPRFLAEEMPPQHEVQGYLVDALAQLESMPFAAARHHTAHASPVLVHTLVDMARAGQCGSPLWCQLISLLHWDVAQRQPAAVCLATEEDIALFPAEPASASPLHSPREASTAVLAAEVAQALARLAMQPLLGDNPRAVAGLLRLLAAFVASAARPEAVATVLEHCEVQFQCLQVALRGAPEDLPLWLQVAAPLLELYAALAAQCHVPAAGSQLLTLLVSGQAAAKLLAPIARMLASKSGCAALTGDEAAAVAAVLQCAAGLAGLIERQPAMAKTAAAQAEPKGDDVMLQPAKGPALHREDAYLVLSSLVVPPDALLQLLLADPASVSMSGSASTGSGSALRQQALATTAAIFGAPGNPFASNESVTSVYVELHFMQFLKLYNAPAHDASSLDAARGHLQALAAIARQCTLSTRERFQRRQVMAYLAAELDLELQAVLAPTQPPASQRSEAGSTINSARSLASSMDRRSSLPPSKRSSLDLEPANPARGLGAVTLLPLGSRASSSSRPIPPLDLASRVAAGTSPAGGGPGGLRSSRSNRSITWAGEDGQGGEVTGRESDYDSETSPRTPATSGPGSHRGASQQSGSAPPSARPPSVPSLNLVGGRDAGGGGARSRRSARSQPGSGRGKGATTLASGVSQRAGSSSARSAADSLGSGRPQTPAQRLPVLPAAAAAIPRLSLSAKAGAAADSSGAAGRPPSSHLGSGRAGSSRIGPTGADSSTSGPTTPLASPPQSLAVLGAPVVAGSPTKAAAMRFRQAVSPDQPRRRSLDMPPQPQPPTGSPSRSLSGGLSLALRSSPSPSPEKAGGAPGSSLAMLLSPQRQAAATITAAATSTSPAAVPTPPPSDTVEAARGSAPSMAGSLPAGSAGGSAGAHGGPGSSILSPGGSSARSGGSESGDGSEVDDEGSSDDGSATAASPPAAAPGGMAVPEGFQFTGDLEADLERLEALDLQNESGSDGGSEFNGSAASTPRSPIIPAAAITVSLPPSSLRRGSALIPKLDVDEAPREPGGRPADDGGEWRNTETGSNPGSGPPSQRHGLRALSAMEGAGYAIGKMQAVQRPMQDFEDYQSLGPLDYELERSQRRVYADRQLHLAVLELVVSLLLRPDGSLDPMYTDAERTERKAQNVPFILQHHLDHRSNAGVIAPLLEWSRLLGPGGPRLLRLLCRCLFNGGLYTHRSRIARGAYAHVMRAEAPALGRPETGVALKVTDMPSSVHDGHALVDAFSEVTLLESFAQSPSVCQLWDYGVEGDSFVLVLRRYACSLAQWRAALPPDPAPHLRLYLSVFADVLRAVQTMHTANVVHFDLKCDNVLLEPLGAAADVWDPPAGAADAPFRVVLADFGESRAFGNLSPGSAVTSRNRGTECVKSPEMLLVANSRKTGRDSYDRRKREGAGAASDLWSLGCLLYELATGRFLFHDPDWIRFFMRVTRDGGAVLPPERAEAVADLPGVLPLLELMLMRDARRRPSIPDVLKRLERIQAELASQPALPNVVAQQQRARLLQQPSQAAAAAASLAAAPSASSGGLPSSGSNTARSGRRATASAEVRLPYVTCEFYLGVLSRLAPQPLWLGSAPGLRSPAPLAEAAIAHVLLLCRAAVSHPAAGGSAAHTPLPGGMAAGAAPAAATAAEAGASDSEASGSGALPGHSLQTTAQAASGSVPANAAPGATAEAQAAGFSMATAAGPPAAAAGANVEALLLDALGDGAVRAAVRSCAAAGAACTLVPLPPPQDADEEAPDTAFRRQLPRLLDQLAALPADARVLIAAAAGLDGEAAVLAAARLAVLRGTTAYQALISVSHRRLALQLKERHVTILADWAAAHQEA